MRDTTTWAEEQAKEWLKDDEFLDIIVKQGESKVFNKRGFKSRISQSDTVRNYRRRKKGEKDGK